MQTKRLTREAIARLEVGQTEITGLLSKLLTLFFLLSIFLVPAIQLVLTKGDKPLLPSGTTFVGEKTADSSLFHQVNKKNKEFLKGLDHFETTLEENSFLRDFFLPPLQRVYLRVLNQGNEKVVAGRKGWLFFRPGVDAIVGQPFLDAHQLELRRQSHEIWEKPVQPDAVAAIIDFNRQLAQRGITLLVVPVPIKPSIHPEKISGSSVDATPVNRSWAEFKKRMVAGGVELFDSRPILKEYRASHGSAFLTTDTHWLPGAMEMVAESLASYILQRGWLDHGLSDYRFEKETYEGTGDIAKMLNLPDTDALYPKEVVELSRVLGVEDEFWRPAQDAELLLLGDSFTNIYSIDGLGWGAGAGFAEHLSYALKTPIDLMARNDSGAYVTREMLATELARGRDRLDGKRVLVWQFAERELALGDWRLINLELGEPRDSEFYQIDSGENVQVRGTLASISSSPRPGSVPYRDNIITMHLVDLFEKDEAIELGQAVVYGFGMRDNKLTRLALLRPGDSVELVLKPWDEVEAEYGSYRRSPLDDEMMELELPNWGE